MRQAVEVIYRQVGWMTCVACSDSRVHRGSMFVGHDRLGQDELIVCVECKGTAEVPRYKVLNASTGLEIDYETFGRTRADEPEPSNQSQGVSP